jgi:hypothetical protein
VPPFTTRDGSALTALPANRGLTPVYWDIDSSDWEIDDVEQVHQGVMRDLQSAFRERNSCEIFVDK